MTETTITCAHCNGHDFQLHITLDGGTSLLCVNHEAHVEQLDLPAQRAAHDVMSDIEDGRER